MVRKLFIVMPLVLLVWACGVRTTVVLVKDDDGRVGQVDVTAGPATQTLKSAREYTVATDALSKTRVMDEKTIQKDFAGALAAQPEKPASYLVFFDPGGVELTPESQAETPQIVSAIRARSHPAVSIIGHTDTTGTDAVNMKISLERAEAVAKLLVERGISRSVMTLQYFGKSDLLIPTADQVAEPKNRRVEVFVR